MTVPDKLERWQCLDMTREQLRQFEPSPDGGVKLAYTRYHKGDRIMVRSIAQDKGHVATDGNISVWFFSYPSFLLVWWMHADRRGSGRLLEVLRGIERDKGKPVWVSDPMFGRLRTFCSRHRFRVVSGKVIPYYPRKPREDEIGEDEGELLCEDTEDLRALLARMGYDMP